MIMERLHAGWYALLASLRASVIALRHHPCRHDVYVERPSAVERSCSSVHTVEATTLTATLYR